MNMLVHVIARPCLVPISKNVQEMAIVLLVFCINRCAARLDSHASFIAQSGELSAKVSKKGARKEGDVIYSFFWLIAGVNVIGGCCRTFSDLM